MANMQVVGTVISVKPRNDVRGGVICTFSYRFNGKECQYPKALARNFMVGVGDQFVLELVGMTGVDVVRRHRGDNA